MKCEDCYEREAKWNIYIKEEWIGDYYEDPSSLCDDCLILAFIGYHTGGGETLAVIDRAEYIAGNHPIHGVGSKVVEELNLIGDIFFFIYMFAMKYLEVEKE